ncbi:MAG TPA: hypothetical protein DIT01_19410 [Lentisphaeria bacterium]|nr:hypothetical protein [Lentisphaeria bacterium]
MDDPLHRGWVAGGHVHAFIDTEPSASETARLENVTEWSVNIPRMFPGTHLLNHLLCDTSFGQEKREDVMLPEHQKRSSGQIVGHRQEAPWQQPRPRPGHSPALLLSLHA